MGNLSAATRLTDATAGPSESAICADCNELVTDCPLQSVIVTCDPDCTGSPAGYGVGSASGRAALPRIADGVWVGQQPSAPRVDGHLFLSEAGLQLGRLAPQQKGSGYSYAYMRPE